MAWSQYQNVYQESTKRVIGFVDSFVDELMSQRFEFVVTLISPYV